MEPDRLQFALPRLTPGVKILLLINTGVFVLTAILGSSLLGEPLSYLLAISWNGLWEFYGLGVLRLVTHQFAHSYFDPFHFLFNMLVLYFFGTMVEGEVGKRGIVHLYLVGGIVGALVQLGLYGVMGQGGDRGALGASGACYSIMLYAACMAPRMRVIFLIFPIEMRWLVGVLVGIGLYSTLLELRGDASGRIAHGAHLGGALYGWLAFKRFRGYYLALGYRGGRLFPWFAQWRANRAAEDQVARQRRVDELLEKVHREGMSSLSGSERRFLEKASRDARRR